MRTCIQSGLKYLVFRTDEIIFGGSTFDPAARIRSLELTLDALSA